MTSRFIRNYSELFGTVSRYGFLVSTKVLNFFRSPRVECWIRISRASFLLRQQRNSSQMSAPQPAQMQHQPQVVVVQGQNFKEPPGCCYNFWCPPCAVAQHEGCGVNVLISCCLGPCFNLLCWTPKKVPVWARRFSYGSVIRRAPVVTFTRSWALQMIVSWYACMQLRITFKKVK
jgi:hypothetical protein